MNGWSMFKRGASLLLAGSLLMVSFCACNQSEQEETKAQIIEGSEPKGGYTWPFNISGEETTDTEMTDVDTTTEETIEPETTTAEATELETTEAETTALETTEPETTEPVTTEPETTEPEITEPVTTEPETTEPEITEPETTEPVDANAEEFETFPLEIIHPEIGSGEITASVLNVREYPGKDYEIVGGFERGTRVTVYEYVLVDGEPWGRIFEGWVSMEYVAMDDDVVGTWYQELGSDPSTGELRYGFWTFDLSGEFRYVVYAFDEQQVRQVSRSGGEFRMDGTRMALNFSYGKEDVIIGGITTAVPGYVTLNWSVIGKIMTLQDVQKTTLTRGTVEKLMKQLQPEEP